MISEVFHGIQTHENSLVHGSLMGTIFYPSISWVLRITLPMKKLSTETFMGISQDNGNFMAIA